MKDYKTILQERVYQREGQNIAYELLAENGPDHDKTFVFQVCITGKVMGRGTGHSKKEAEQQAARMALEKMTERGQGAG